MVRHGSKVAFWNAMPTMVSGPDTVSPSTRAVPESAGIRPETIFSSEDLPQPDGPTTATNSPRPMVSDASATAGVPASGPP